MKRHIEKLERVMGEAVNAVSVDKLKKGLKSGDYEYAGTTDGMDGNKYHVVHDLKRNSTMQYLATPKMKWIVKYEGAPSKRKKPDWTLRGKKVFDEDKGSEGLSEGRKPSNKEVLIDWLKDAYETLDEAAAWAGKERDYREVARVVSKIRDQVYAVQKKVETA
jgi:hypothetical protein